MNGLRLSAFAVLLSACVAGRADTISTFSINGASLFSNGNTVSGATTIDVTTGVVQSISFTAGGSFQSGVDSQSGPVVFVGPAMAKISFDAGSLINFMGGAFDLNGPNDLYVGHVTGPVVVPPAATPEPSSLILLSTGVLGFAAAVRRRGVGWSGLRRF